MKLILFIFFIILIVIHQNPLMPDCSTRTALQAIPPLTQYNQSLDEQKQPTIITRFYHNKVEIFSKEFGKCYARLLDFNLIYETTGPIGLAFWLYAVYKAIEQKKWYLIGLIVAFPLIYFLRILVELAPYIYKLVSTLGLFYFLKFNE